MSLMIVLVLAAACRAATVSFSVMSYNVLYANLGANWRLDGVSTTVANEAPDIFSIQELWSERWDLLERIQDKTGLPYELCNSGSNQMKWWDGKIFYRADRWENLEDGVDIMEGGRGMTHAAIRHRATGAVVLVYGVHPLCCGAEHAHLMNMEQIVNHMVPFKQKYSGAPIIFMGDFNEVEDGPAMRLLRDGSLNGWFNRDWSVPLTFVDTFREVRGWNVDATTRLGCCRLDYVYRDAAGGLRPTGARILAGSPGGSDHLPVTAELEFDFDGEWTPVELPTAPPTEPLNCPAGSVQVGSINADIDSCGLTECSARHQWEDIAECLTECRGREDCVAFTWAPVGGDRLNRGVTVCSLYGDAKPNAEWGPFQIFCRVDSEEGPRPTPPPSSAPAPPSPSLEPEALACAPGSEQVGTLTENNDVGGCGFNSCDDRFSVDSLEDCAANCRDRSDCNSYNWTPVGGDRNWPDQKVCSLYSDTAPNHSWGPKQIFCRMAEEPVTDRPTPEATVDPTLEPSAAPAVSTDSPSAASTDAPSTTASCGVPGKLKKPKGLINGNSAASSACECELLCVEAEAAAFRFHGQKGRCQCYESFKKVKKSNSSPWISGAISLA